VLAPIEPTARSVFTGDNVRRVASLLTSLGKARTRLGDASGFTAAESNLLEAHAIFVRLQGESHKSTKECGRLLAALYSAWNAAEPGGGYEGKAAEWKARCEAVPSSGELVEAGEKKK
jgi:hypothetical protein